MDGSFSAKPRKVYDKISIYHGSQWWALTRACVRYILDHIDRNTDYMNFHAHTLCPDEIFFHSLVKNSPFAASITHDFKSAGDLSAFFARSEHGCHYVDWSKPLPKVLNEADFDALVNSGAYFARKFREGSSDKLLELIQAHTQRF